MSGVDRLRALAGAWDEWGLGGALTEIADEIERDFADARMGHVSLMRVLKVASDMEHHILGHEGMEDSPVARWARELRSLCDWLDNAEPVYPMTVLLRRCKEFGVDTSDCEDGEDVLNNLIETLRQRLMPEGCEWPRYESGDLVMFGDCVENRNGICTVNSVRFYRGGGVSVYGEDSGAQFVVVTEPVMRDPIRKANPKVIAADGEPLEVGQTVWHVATGSEYTVVGLPKSGEYQVVKLRLDDGAFTGLDPDQLTHQRPALDADGVPIKVGDTVWPKHPYDEPDRQVESAEVVYVHRLGRIDIQAKYATGMSFRQQIDADKLTHTKPEPVDTWQRIEEDARGLDSGVDRELFTHTHEDLVRRCRALADRERGE